MTVARELAMALKARPDDIHVMSPDEKQTISIDRVRELYRLTRTVYDSPRVIIIDDAEAIRPIGEAASKEFLASQGVESADQQKMLFIAGGLPAELARLGSNQDYFKTQAEIVTTARALLQSEQYDRLITIKDIKDRSSALALVAMVGRLLEFSILRQKRTDLASALDIIESVTARLHANGNVKIQLTYLVSQLP